MPQWRKLHTKITESMDVNDMPDDFTRLLWIMLPTQLCREGRGVDNPSWVRSRVFPMREDVTVKMIVAAMDWYERRGMIVRYQVEQRAYFHVPTFARYQGNTTKESESEYPSPPDLLQSHSRPTPELVESRSASDSDSDSDSDVDSDVDSTIGAIAPELPPDVVPIESEPEPGRPPDKDTPHRRYMAVVRDVTMLSLDVEQNAKRVGRAVRGLRKAEYAADDVMRLYRKGGWWWREYWKGRNGQPPTPEELASTIEQGLEYERNGSARASPGGSGNGRLTGAAAREAFLGRHSGDT